MSGGRADASTGAVVARAPGSCGELVQGAIAGVDFHVSCPIDVYAEARAEPLNRAGGEAPETGAASGWDHLPPKVRRALALFLEEAGIRHVPCSLTLRNPLAPGKGLGSSTADIAGTLAAFAACAGVPLAPRELAALALRVEPSDGTMLPGIAILDHRRGRLAGTLGDPPPLEVLIFDQGGGVDTLAFNARPDLDRLNRAKEPEVREALDLVRRGLDLARAGREKAAAELIGAGATLSALAHQRILPKPRLEEVLRLARGAGAVGVTVAHSGTVIGILCDPARAPAAAIRPHLEARLGAPLVPARVVGGGTRVTAAGAKGDEEGGDGPVHSWR